MKRKCCAWIVILGLMAALSVPATAAAVGASDAPDAPDLISAPSSMDAVTLSDLVTVAQYLAGSETLSQEQVERYDLQGDGQVTLSDLVLLARQYTAEMNGEQLPPEPNPETATVTVVGAIVSSDEEEATWYIRGENDTAADDTGIIISDNTIIVDCVTGEVQDASALVEGTRVAAYISTLSMPSLPPRAACDAVLLNYPEGGVGHASYVQALQVRTAPDGAAVVLNQNADLYVTIPQDIPIGVLGQPEVIAAPSDIQEGTRMIAWFDIVGLSFPGQTTALRVLIEPMDEPSLPRPSIEHATMSIDGTIESIDESQNTIYINGITDGTENELGAVVTNNTVLVDCAAGAPADRTAFQAGDHVAAFLSTDALPDWPPRAECRALLMNLPEPAEGNITYVYALSAETSDDEPDTKILLNQNADLYIILNSETQLGVFGQPDAAVTMEDIEEGSRLLVWYQRLLLTNPLQTTAVRALVIPES